MLGLLSQNHCALAASSYELGVNAYQDNAFELARKYWQESAIQGIVHAQFNLGVMLYKGIGGVADTKSGVTFFEKTAKAGIASGQYNLALAYYLGSGIEMNKQLALHWWQRAAEQGHIAAKYNLATLIWNGNEHGIVEDKEAALKLFKQASLADMPQAISFMKNFTTNTIASKDKLKPFDKMTEQESTKHQPFSVSKVDYNEANSKIIFESWNEEAQKGDADAQYRLSELYRKGLGVKQNDKLAYKFVQMSAQQGHAQAQYQLALIYLASKIVDKNETLALFWMQSAADNNHSKAKEYLEQKRQ